MATPASNTLDKGLRLLEVVIDHGGGAPIARLADEAGIPASTAHRILGTLQRRGFVARAARGDYLPGPTLIRLGRTRDIDSVLKAVARPLMESLSKRIGMTTHLGMLDDDMVTYLVKVRGEIDVLTQEGLQLEAYCSGIGKVLLAALPEVERERYLGSSPFVRLTENTIVEPDLLRAELRTVRTTGYAIDNGEIDIHVRCLAVPVRVDGRVFAAISLSTSDGGLADPTSKPHLDMLQQTARLIEASLQRRPVPNSIPNKAA